jgi:hypothetical protein
MLCISIREIGAMNLIHKTIFSGVLAATLLFGGMGQAQAHNLLLVAGNPQIVIFRLTSGDVVVTKVLADKDVGVLNDIRPAAGK